MNTSCVNRLVDWLALLDRLSSRGTILCATAIFC